MAPLINARIVTQGRLTMADVVAGNKDIKELQRLARQARAEAPRRRKRLSRAAHLAAIDLLSRWSAAGLALFAGIGVFLSITLGRHYPARAAAWALMLLAALYVCRRLQSKFRSGAELAAHPFRWRASFTACLCVVGVAFASAPILLAPYGAPAGLAAQTAALTLIGAFGAALFFCAHGAGALAAAAPGVAFCALAAWRNADASSALFIALASVAGAGVLLAANRLVTGRLAAQHPRTTLLRSEVEQRPASGADANSERGVA